MEATLVPHDEMTFVVRLLFVHLLTKDTDILLWAWWLFTTFLGFGFGFAMTSFVKAMIVTLVTLFVISITPCSLLCPCHTNPW